MTSSGSCSSPQWGPSTYHPAWVGSNMLPTPDCPQPARSDDPGLPDGVAGRLLDDALHETCAVQVTEHVVLAAREVAVGHVAVGLRQEAQNRQVLGVEGVGGASGH